MNILENLEVKHGEISVVNRWVWIEPDVAEMAHEQRLLATPSVGYQSCQSLRIRSASWTPILAREVQYSSTFVALGSARQESRRWWHSRQGFGHGFCQMERVLSHLGPSMRLRKLPIYSCALSSTRSRIEALCPTSLYSVSCWGIWRLSRGFCLRFLCKDSTLVRNWHKKTEIRA